jgi:Disulphide bond corrector protein DsbC
VLHQYAAAKGIRFPLLSDAGSRVITELGLLDRDLAEHHAAFGLQARESQFGVAYPSIFVLDEGGRVVGKRIGESYRAREGALKLVDEALGVTLPAAGPQSTAIGSRVKATAFTDSPTYMRWQETRLHVVFDVEPGWHLYGRPIPDCYTALTLEVEGAPELDVHEAQYPPTHPFRVDGLDEEFHVYEGHFEVIVPFALKVAQGHGRVGLKVNVAYQACSETDCLAPTKLVLELHLDELAPA